MQSRYSALGLIAEHGGVYVDSHTGPSDGDALAATLEDLTKFDMLLFGKGWEGGFNFMNSILIARRQALVLQLILAGAFTNLINHERCEANSAEQVPYHVLDLTGTTVMLECIFDKTAENAWRLDWDMKPEYRKTIGFRHADKKIQPRIPYLQVLWLSQGRRSLERTQKHERLFA